MRGGEIVDREKVIADIEEQITWIRDNDFHKFPGWGHAVLAMQDAIALLKEQEAVEPKKVKGYNPPMYTLYEYDCKECKSPMMNKQPFCMGCGRAVKLE